MRKAGTAARRRELLAELHYTQQMNRVDARCLVLGRAKAKRLGAALRALAREKA